jgi:RNA polymerase sigma-70 factor, ECF subfamily
MDSTTSSPQEREQRFREIYDAAYVDLLRFVRRRVHPSHAEDVVGDVMLVAWRRLDDVPDDLSSARAWLFGVARKSIQNARRGDNRHDAVAVRLAEVRHSLAHAGQHPDLVAHRADIAAAWPLLSALHQEAIALSVLDGLSARPPCSASRPPPFVCGSPVPGAFCGASSTPSPPMPAYPASSPPTGVHDEQAHRGHHGRRCSA